MKEKGLGRKMELDKPHFPEQEKNENVSFERIPAWERASAPPRKRTEALCRTNAG